MQNEKEQFNNLFWLGAFLALMMTIAGILYFYSSPKTNGNIGSESLDKFAMCLADKDVTMYGAVWCSHCQSQKKEFGSSFQYIKYVECPDNIKICLDKGVVGYPTWIFNDGSKLEGEQSFAKLSEKSGCPIE